MRIRKAGARSQPDCRREPPRFERVVENGQDLFYRYRLNPFAMEYVSPAAWSITGRTPHEFYENPRLIQDAVHPDDRDKAAAMQTRPGNFADPVTLRWVHPDGQIVCVEHRNNPVYGAGGELLAIEASAGTSPKRLPSSTGCSNPRASCGGSPPASTRRAKPSGPMSRATCTTSSVRR
jgi:PAS domain-containing protein